MIKYVVTWIAISNQSIPCPDYKQYQSNTSCAVYHFKKVKEKKEMHFDNQYWADCFVATLRNVDSVKVEIKKVK